MPYTKKIPMTVNEVYGILPVLSTKPHEIFMFFRGLHTLNVTEWTFEVAPSHPVTF